MCGSISFRVVLYDDVVAVFLPPLVINDDQLVTVLAVKLRSPKGAFYAAKAGRFLPCRGINSKALLVKYFVVTATQKRKGAKAPHNASPSCKVNFAKQKRGGKAP